ncbi:hypothetical protein AgCh_009530 [Apium graveolens]
MPTHRDRRNQHTIQMVANELQGIVKVLQGEQWEEIPIAQDTNAIAQQQQSLQQQFQQQQFRNQENHDQHQHQPDPPQQIMTFKTFQNVNPPAFYDTTDPVVAKTWIREMERSFKLVRLGEEQKTIYATYFLKGEAIYWWDLVKALEEVQPVTWTRMSMFEIGTYAGVVQKAALIESNGAQSRKEIDNKKRKKGWNAQKKGEVIKRQDNKGNHQQIRVKRMMTNSQGSNKGHLANECKVQKPGVICYKYGKVGHIAKECRSTRLIKSMMNIASTSTAAPPEMLALPPPPIVTPQASARTSNLK